MAVGIHSVAAEWIIGNPTGRRVGGPKCGGSGGLPIGVWTHVAVVMDGHGVVLYTNGVPIATNAYANLVPANLNPTNCWFGRSQFAADPYFSGQLSSVRLFSLSLSAADILAPQITIAQPAQGAVYRWRQKV